MTQHELLGILNTNMLQAMRNREKVDPALMPEQRGYWFGAYKTYEEMIRLLVLVDIHETNVSAPAVTPVC